jgi:hypothetical protein
MSPRNTLALICLLVSTAVQADIYRCVIDGRTTFRDRPCPPGEQQSTARDAKPAWEGCYAIETSGWESGRRTDLMRFAGSAGHYTMTSVTSAGQKSDSLPMRRAAPDELRDAARLLQFEVSDGMVLVVPAGTPNQPALPIGLYKGRDAYRDIKYFFFGFLSNGPAKPVPCP